MAGQGSARVTLKEIDLSQVRNPQQAPQGVPAAVVGPARKGPAFVPRTFANMQQFEEVFGSLNTRGRLTNSNLYGPLALNEWMRSAQAGTYLRVLGVGDGNPSTGGRVQDAGFIVGEKQVHVSEDGTLGKLSDNPFANIGENPVKGRTHFLGCFMKDAPGSSYLKDAGLSTQESSASILIDFDDKVPDNNSIITLKADNGDGTFTILTYGFSNVGDVVEADVTISTAGGANSVAALLANEIQNNHSNLNAVATIDNAARTGSLTITQANTGSTGNTIVTVTINNSTEDSIKIQGSETIFNSTEDATFRFRELQGLAKDSATITPQENAIEGNDTFEIQSKDVEGADVSVTYTLKSEAALRAEAVADPDAAVEAGYFYTGQGQCSVLVVSGLDDDLSNNKATLSNLKAAIEDESTNNSISGLILSSIDAQGVLTLTQQFAGDLGRRVIYTDAGLVSVAFNVVDFAGGADLASLRSQVTLTMSGQPNVDDVLTLPGIGGGAAEIFKFVAESAGTLNGIANGGDVQVEIGQTVDVTLDNLRDALLNNDGVSLDKNNIDVELDVVAGSIKIIAKGNGGLLNNKELTFNLSENVRVSNPTGELLIGNFGEKTTSFVGGETNAAHPIVRGVLMTPQGVVATLSSIADVGGDTEPAQALTADSPVGHSVGTLGINQSFTVFLSGNKGKRSISCSFDPANPAYFAKVLNTDPTKIEELGHYLYAWWDIESSVALPSQEGLLHAGAVISDTPYDNMIAFCVVGEDTDRESGNLNYESFAARYQTAKTPWITSQDFGGVNFKLFRLHALDDGEISNGMFRLQISNLRYSSGDVYGRFDLALERLTSNPQRGDALFAWTNLSLDPDDRNYIARVIGDQRVYYNFELEESKQRLQSEGTFEVRNNYVRVEMSDDLIAGNVPLDALPAGFLSHAYLNTAVPLNFVEDPALEDKRVFTDANNDPIDILSKAEVAPLKFVKSISRVVNSTTKEADAVLAWGVKLAKKEYVDSDFKELSEIANDTSIVSYAKYFPHFNNVFVEDTGIGAAFQNGRFSLEKIQIPASKLSDADEIVDWSEAVYRQEGVLDITAAGRFVKISKDAIGKNVRFLKFRCLFQGGFDGVNIFDKEKAEFTGVASLREGGDETGTNKYTGPTVMAYRRACDVLTDKSAVEFQVLALPGQRASVVTDYALSACEERFDALYLMDIVEKDSLDQTIESDLVKPHVRNTVLEFSRRGLDSSFGAAYFPNVMVRRPSDSASVSVPPSVGMLGVLSRNDQISAPWFAPAGLNRGRLNSTGVKVQMNRDLLDELYDADINPIYEPAGRAGEVYAFGQKTLMQDSSALDRINVRRLLIDIRRKVKRIGESLLFEPNRASTLARFSALVEPIMADVQSRQGVARYKVQIDSSTTTQNDIENNTIRGKIYLQPLKSIEFISLDFVVANTIE